ncbi:hypothetical protein V7166_22480 [Bacillus thuringiensis]
MYSPSIINWKINLIIHDEKGFVHLEFCFDGDLAKTFNGAYANFWFSHIPKENIFSFLEQFHEVLESGSIVCMVDNMYNEGMGGTLISKPDDENTYKIRSLASGQQYEIIKNYYSKEELTTIFEPFAVDLEIHMNTCFWIVTYKVK